MLLCYFVQKMYNRKSRLAGRMMKFFKRDSYGDVVKHKSNKRQMKGPMGKCLKLKEILLTGFTAKKDSSIIATDMVYSIQNS